MTTIDSPAPRIEELFCQGHPLDHVVAAGQDVGWSRGDVMAVLRERQWDLDGSGRLPRSKRTTVPRGLRGLPPAPIKATSTTSRNRLAVPDRHAGHPLPFESPTPAKAIAEQSALAVPVGAPPERWLPPVDDPRLPEMVGSVTVEPIELARDIRARVDEIAPRANPDGSVNASHVAMEQTLRDRHGLSSYIASLDGPGKFLPQPEPEPVVAAALPASRTLKPIEHGTPRGVAGHKRHGIPVPDDDSCGCSRALKDRQAAYQRDSYRRKHPHPPESPPRDDGPTQPAVTLEVADDLPTQVAEPAPAPDRRPVGRDLDDWLFEARGSKSPAVRRHAVYALGLLQELHDELDELVRAEATGGR